MSFPRFIHTPMRKMLAIFFGVIVTLAFIKYRQIASAIAQAKMSGPPIEAVTTAKAMEVEWAPTAEFVASLAPTQGITVSAEQSGKVVRIGFESGAEVKVGDLLIQLDTSVEEGELIAAEARLALARQNMKRAQGLQRGNAMSESAVETTLAALRQGEGEVAAIRGVIAKKTVVAPFAGATGIRMVNVGQYVAEGAPLVPLYATDSVFVNFAVPQQQLKSLAKGQEVSLSIDAWPEQAFRGSISSVNPQVDSSTRSVAVQATFSAEGGKLRPGMFATVAVNLGVSERFVVIPLSGVSHAPYGDSGDAAVPDPANKEQDGAAAPEQKTVEKKKDAPPALIAEQRFVKLGRSKGDFVAVLDGVKAGEEIVSSGLFKLRPNAAIIVNNTLAPPASETPTPADT